VGQGTFAARITLGLDALRGKAPRVHVWLRTLEGKTGVGVLSADGKTFLVERSVRPSAHAMEVILPLPSPPVSGDLVIRNVATGNAISKAIIERIEIRIAR